MKMSKSIKDYKDAMDNIKISDSFYRRTEALLNESSDVKVEKAPSRRNRLILHSAVGIAACLIVGIGVKTAIDNRSRAESAVTEILTIETETSVVNETASPVVDAIEDDSEFGDMPEIPTDVVPTMDSGETENAPAATFSSEETITTTVSTEEKITEDDTPDVAEEEIPDVDVDSDELPNFPHEETEPADKEGYPEMAEPQGSADIPPLEKTADSRYSIEITPYFDMGAVKSGETTVSLSGEGCSELMNCISEIAETSTTMDNYSFTSVFSINITDTDTDITVYSIYVTSLNTVIVTRHDIADQQRTTYGVSDRVYNRLMHMLFLSFGDEEEYLFFRSMID